MSVEKVLQIAGAIWFFLLLSYLFSYAWKKVFK